jgi:hypothetical protein
MSPLKVPAVSFQWMMDTSHAEPEAELEPVAPVARQNVRAPEVPGEEAPARPRVVHFPRCECGTSGIVCACSD